MYVELPWQRRQHRLLFDEMERLSQVDWPDVAMHAALSHTDVEDLFSKKNTNSPIWQKFQLKAGEYCHHPSGQQYRDKKNLDIV